MSKRSKKYGGVSIMPMGAKGPAPMSRELIEQEIGKPPDKVLNLCVGCGKFFWRESFGAICDSCINAASVVAEVCKETLDGDMPSCVDRVAKAAKPIDRIGIRPKLRGEE